MLDNFRRFEAVDPFGRKWSVEYRWQQTAISIRHSDSVDVKFQLSQGDDVMERVIALPHPILLDLSENAGRPLTDAWCLKLAALHLKTMIETDRDMDKTLVTASMDDLQRCRRVLEQAVPAMR